MKKSIQISLLLFACLVGLQPLSAISCRGPITLKECRTSPVIVRAIPIDLPNLYPLNQYEYGTVVSYKITSVEKNILISFDSKIHGLGPINTIQPHEIIHLHSYDGCASGPLNQMRKSHQSDEFKRYYFTEKLLLLTYDASTTRRQWTGYQLPLKYAGSSLEQKEEEGWFKPLGIDGIAANYTEDEWHEIVKSNISSRPRGQITYVIQSFIDARVTKPK